jgi:hypothetical protein
MKTKLLKRFRKLYSVTVVVHLACYYMLGYMHYCDHRKKQALRIKRREYFKACKEYAERAKSREDNIYTLNYPAS